MSSEATYNVIETLKSELSRLQQENENEKKARLAACKLSQIDQERAESAERELKALQQQLETLRREGPVNPQPKSARGWMGARGQFDAGDE